MQKWTSRGYLEPEVLNLDIKFSNPLLRTESPLCTSSTCHVSRPTSSKWTDAGCVELLLSKLTLHQSQVLAPVTSHQDQFFMSFVVPQRICKGLRAEVHVQILAQETQACTFWKLTHSQGFTGPWSTVEPSSRHHRAERSLSGCREACEAPVPLEIWEWSWILCAKDLGPLTCVFPEAIWNDCRYGKFLFGITGTIEMPRATESPAAVQCLVAARTWYFWTSDRSCKGAAAETPWLVITSHKEWAEWASDSATHFWRTCNAFLWRWVPFAPLERGPQVCELQHEPTTSRRPGLPFMRGITNTDDILPGPQGGEKQMHFNSKIKLNLCDCKT